MLAEPGPNARLRGVLVAGIDGIQNYEDDDLNIERFEVLHNPCYVRKANRCVGFSLRWAGSEKRSTSFL